MDEIAKVAMDEFKKESDGSWVCVKNSDITTKLGSGNKNSHPARLSVKGFTLSGIDIAAALDKLA